MGFTRKIVTATVRSVGVTELEAEMVVAVCENKKSIVAISGLSEEYPVNIGLMQGSALIPFVLIVVTEIISSKIDTNYVLRKMMYADDIYCLW